MQKVFTALQGIGLSVNEIKVYFAILEKPQSNISALSKISGVKRTTLYPYLEGLLEKGFVSKTIKGKMTLYIPEDPTNIVSLFEEKKRVLERNIPFLQEYFNKRKSKNTTQLFYGKKQLDNMYTMMSHSTTNIYTFFSPGKYFKIYGKSDSDAFNATVYKNQVKLYDLVEDNEQGREYLKYISHSGKILPKEFKDVWMDMLIFEDKVCFVSFESMTAIVIQDITIHNFMKTMYKFIWKGIN